MRSPLFTEERHFSVTLTPTDAERFERFLQARCQKARTFIRGLILREMDEFDREQSRKAKRGRARDVGNRLPLLT
jgi:hypothetical protein